MIKTEVTAHAKINISLDVLGKRKDGYHELKTIMQTIALHDTVALETIKDGINLECNYKWLPTDSTNIAFKAAALMKDKYYIKSGVNIKLTKRIPVAAGLAGGSADAAAVMRGMNEMFSLSANTDELMDLGKQLGADVPFCIRGGTKLAEGIGERLSELPDFSNVEIVLVKPRIGVPTSWVYENLDFSKIDETDKPNTKYIINAMERRDIRSVAQGMRNVLETVVIERYSAIREAKTKLREFGALGSMMSGSGPTVFGIFSDSKTAVAAYKKMVGDKRWQCFYTKTVVKKN